MTTERDARNNEEQKKMTKKKASNQPEPLNKQDPTEPVEVEQQTSSRSKEREKPAGVQ
jgi:hypothetical protein